MLIIFTVYVPQNSGLERFNYFLLREFYNQPVRFVKERGEIISEIVEELGGYGWTGNDLFSDYRASGKGDSLRILKTISWPEEIKPRLCLLGPLEILPERQLFSDRLYVVVADKYQNLARRYFETKRWSPGVSFLRGQVDRQIRLGKADLAIDIVYTGKTILEERLAIYDILFDRSGFILLTKD